MNSVVPPRILKATLISCFLCVGILSLAYAAESITFKGGFTRAIMREGRETIMLTQGAVVETGTIRFEAQNIELVGPESRYLVGTGSVRIIDSLNSITITCNSISFDRQTEQLLVDGWVEIQEIGRASCRERV